MLSYRFAERLCTKRCFNRLQAKVLIIFQSIIFLMFLSAQPIHPREQLLPKKKKKKKKIVCRTLLGQAKKGFTKSFQKLFIANSVSVENWKILISLFRFLDTMPQRHVLHSKKWTRKGTAQHEKSKFDMYDTVWLFWGIMLLEPFPKKAEKLNYRIERFIGWSVSFREIPCCRHSVWCAAFPDSLSH